MEPALFLASVSYERNGKRQGEMIISFVEREEEREWEDRP